MTCKFSILIVSFAMLIALLSDAADSEDQKCAETFRRLNPKEMNEVKGDGVWISICATDTENCPDNGKDACNGVTCVLEYIQQNGRYGEQCVAQNASLFGACTNFANKHKICSYALCSKCYFPRTSSVSPGTCGRDTYADCPLGVEPHTCAKCDVAVGSSYCSGDCANN